MLNTVFVVGAGASKEFGFPVGKKLQEEVADLLQPRSDLPDVFDPTIIFAQDELRNRGMSGNALFELCEWMNRTIPLYPSIDTFLDKHSDGADAVSFLGKLAIMRVISRCETSSDLATLESKNLDWAALSKTWLGKLWIRMNQGGLANRAPDPLPGVSFVTFNYDRCMEQFITLALSQSYNVNFAQARDIARNVPVEHVYGTIAPIFGEIEFASFGSIRHPSQCGPYTKNIKTFTEQADSEVSERILRLLDNADRIVFIGFSFGKMNREFFEDLTRNGPYRNSMDGHPVREILGTSYKMSVPDSRLAEEWAGVCFNGMGHRVELSPREAATFFDMYSLKFSA